MLRRWHRWVALTAGIVILWIAATGVVTQAARILNAGDGPPKAEATGPAAAPAAPPAAEAPRPPQSPARAFIHFVTELHSGEAAGLAGELVSLAAGLGLLFLAGSGLFMYVQMFRARSAKVRGGKNLRGGKWFWQ